MIIVLGGYREVAPDAETGESFEQSLSSKVPSTGKPKALFYGFDELLIVNIGSRVVSVDREARPLHCQGFAPFQEPRYGKERA